MLEMTTGPLSVTPPDPTYRSQTILTQPDQLMMTPKIQFSKYNINIIHVVKFIFKYVA